MKRTGRLELLLSSRLAFMHDHAEACYTDWHLGLEPLP
jgi:hypothetical protein